MISRWPALAIPMAGILASLALPPVHFLPLLFALSYPMARMLACKTMWSAFWIGWGCGLGWFFVSLYWISNAMVTGGSQFYWMIPFAILFLPSLLAIFWGLAFALAWRSGTCPTIRWGALIFWLMIMEWFRAHLFTGFPWQSPGMVFAIWPLGFDLASVIGIFGCGVVALLLAGLPLSIRVNKRFGRFIIATLALLFVIALIANQRPLIEHAASGLKVRLVQPAIPQKDKWKSELRNQHLAMHLEQSMARQSTQSETEIPDLIVWGEVSYAGFLESNWESIQSRIRDAAAERSWFILGSLRKQISSDQHHYFNSIYLVQPDAKISGVYDKRYLVPWGEYVPFRKGFAFVDNLAGGIDFSAGSNPIILSLKRADGRVVNIAPLICYEVIFPVSTRKAAIGADLIVNLTNDAWFGDSLGPRQHLAMAQMRAAELGLPMVRVATTGISAAIDAYGNVTSHINYNDSQWKDAVISGRTNTFYASYGELGFFLLLSFCLVAGITFRAQNTSS